MEVADRTFIQGLKLLDAAARLERADGDDKTRACLAGLAQVYRQRGFALMAGEMVEQPAP